MLPFYKMIVDNETEGMDFIALVDRPAHMKAFEYFNNQQKQIFNEEKRIVTGVAIATDLPIYRNSPDIGEHYVIFDKKETFRIAQKMLKNGYAHNVNKDHDSNKVVDGVFLVESYFIDRARGVNEPEAFKNQNLKDGTWITSYYVENDEVWNSIKEGKHLGFSIEGWFDKVPVNINKNQNQKMSKKVKSIKAFIESFTSKKNTFGEAMTVDGVTVVWDGEELNEGIELRVRTEEGEILAPEGEHAIEVDDMVLVIVVDGNGIITGITEVTEESEEASEEVKEEVELKEEEEVSFDEIIIELKKELEGIFSKKVETLKEELSSVKTMFEDLNNEVKESKTKFNQKTKEVKQVKNWKNLN